MSETLYRGRRAWQIENDTLRVTVLVEGGHIAEILYKPAGINPLWTPPWPSIEPSSYSPAKHPEYGSDAESKLLAGVMGHLLCLDLFGPPSAEEAAAGMTQHGEACVNPHRGEARGGELLQQTHCADAALDFARRIRLECATIRVLETVRNVSRLDRPVAWTEHFTFGPPFLEKGVTQFRAPVTKSRTSEEKDFEWPYLNGEDLRVFPSAASSAGFTAHLIDPRLEDAWFLAWSPRSKLLFGCAWRRSDFPWLAIWDENQGSQALPWNGRTLARGMEFGASPMSETRRQMIDRNSLFGVPAYRWISAGADVTAEYSVFLSLADSMPEQPHA